MAEEKIDSERLTRELYTCEKERDSHLEDLKRLKADSLNEKTQRSRSREFENKMYLSEILEKMLPVLDSINSALAFSSDADANLIKGLEQIKNQYTQAFSDLDVILIDSVDESLNHRFHETLEEVDIEDQTKDGKIIEMVRVGARIGDYIIRPAMVKVGVHNA